MGRLGPIKRHRDQGWRLSQTSPSQCASLSTAAPAHLSNHGDFSTWACVRLGRAAKKSEQSSLPV
jgi:hypothetical protein